MAGQGHPVCNYASYTAPLGLLSTVVSDSCFRLNRYVALKVAVAELGPRTHETKILHLLSQKITGIGANRFVRLLDEFQVSGPNGTHDCTVLELLGPEVFKVLETKFVTLPSQGVFNVARQVLEGLSWLHDAGICHGGELIDTFSMYPRVFTAENMAS